MEINSRLEMKAQKTFHHSRLMRWKKKGVNLLILHQLQQTSQNEPVHLLDDLPDPEPGGLEGSSALRKIFQTKGPSFVNKGTWLTPLIEQLLIWLDLISINKL